MAVGAEVARAVAHDGTRGEKARKGLVGNADERVFLVVFGQDIVARFVRLSGWPSLLTSLSRQTDLG